MLGVTLCFDSRYKSVMNLSQQEIDHIIYALNLKFKASGINEDEISSSINDILNTSNVVDLENHISVHYVERDRDFSNFEPVDLSTKENAQPLLDALLRGDFEMAKHLTPKDKRLCGFELVTDDKEITKYQEYAAYFEDYIIPKGVYPILANKFQIVENYNKNDGPQYSNELKDFQGLSILLYGSCVKGNPPIDKPYETRIYENPYAHVIGKLALDKLNSNIQMIAPFKAMEINFISSIENKELTTYGVFDSDLDDKVLLNPMKLGPGIDSLIHDGVFCIKRDRVSVTQGSASIFCNGEKVVQFNDEMWLRTSKDTLTNGFREISNDLKPGNYGELINGWGSIRNDKDLVISAIRMFPKEISKALDNKKLMLDEKIKAAEERASKSYSSLNSKLKGAELSDKDSR